MGQSEFNLAAKDRRPWNAGRISVQKATKLQQVWTIRFWLDHGRRLSRPRDVRSGNRQ